MESVRSLWSQSAVICIWKFVGSGFQHFPWVDVAVLGFRGHRHEARGSVGGCINRAHYRPLPQYSDFHICSQVLHKRREVSLHIPDLSVIRLGLIKVPPSGLWKQPNRRQLHLTRRTRTRTLSRCPWDVVMFLAFRFLKRIFLLIVSLRQSILFSSTNTLTYPSIKLRVIQISCNKYTLDSYFF